MSRFAEMVAAFNDGRVGDVVVDTTGDYRYSDPFFGDVDGAVAHQALMARVLDRFPDRRIEVLGCWVADGAEVARYRWTGTPADGSGAIEVVFVSVLEFQDGHLRRWANYRC